MVKINIIIALLVFGVLIFIHEFGHYLSARIFDVAIKEFAVGMGPRLISRKSHKSGIVYSLRLLPIGGFVSMVGEDEDIDDESSINHKPVWQRFIVMAAGAFMNLLLGFILTAIIVVSSEALGSTIIFRFNEDNSLSQSTGLEIGDQIIKVNKTRIHVVNDLVYAIMRDGIEPVDITVLRNGERVKLENVEFPIVEEDGELYGSIDFKVAPEEKTIGNIIKNTVAQSISAVKMIWQSLLDLITGRYGIDQVSGPIGTTTVISEAAERGTIDFIYICALISLNLGVMNLLPLPALDGGRLVFLIIEFIRKKPLNPEYEGYIHFIGIVLLMLLMLFVTYKDFMKLFIT